MRRSRILSSVMALALIVTSVCIPAGTTSSAKKAALSKKKLSINVGETKVIKVKNSKKTAKVTWKSTDSKIVKIVKKTSKGKKASATVQGIAEGKTVVKAVYKIGKKKTNLKCTVTVKASEVQKPTTTAPSATTPAASAKPGTSVTPSATNTPAQATDVPQPTKEATPKPTRTPRPTAGPTATPTPAPKLTNPYKVDLSAAGLAVGENGGVVSYNAETKTLDSTMGNLNGFIVKNPIKENIEKYSYVEITYELEGGDVNLYLADASMEGDGAGQDAAGWHAEIKLNQYDYGKDVKITYGDDGTDTFTGGYLKAFKIFNFGDETTIKIKDITFYQVEK